MITDITPLLGKIHNCDCLEFMRQLPDKCVDLVLTDPPYGTTQCSWDSVVDFNNMWEGIHRILCDNGVVVMTASQPFTTILVKSNIHNFKY